MEDLDYLEDAKERVLNFKRELSKLLEKYDIMLSASDEWTGYAECGQDIQIDIETQYTSDYVGCYIDKDTFKELDNEN